jgi:hypothetical protein
MSSPVAGTASRSISSLMDVTPHHQEGTTVKSSSAGSLSLSQDFHILGTNQERGAAWFLIDPAHTPGDHYQRLRTAPNFRLG